MPINLGPDKIPQNIISWSIEIEKRIAGIKPYVENIINNLNKVFATKKYVDDNINSGTVPNTRKVNGHELSSDVTVTASDVSAEPKLNGTGFVKSNGTTTSYDNSTYLTSLSGAYLVDQTTPQSIINGDLNINTTGRIFPNSTRKSINIKGTTGSGMMEFTSAAADADATVLGLFQYSDSNCSWTTNKRVASIGGFLDGSTAGKRGGKISFYIRPDNTDSDITEKFYVNNLGRGWFYGNVGIGIIPSANYPLSLYNASGYVMDATDGTKHVYQYVNTVDAYGTEYSWNTHDDYKMFFHAQGTGDIEMWTAGSKKIWLNNAGKYGIGVTSTPLELLSVNNPYSGSVGDIYPIVVSQISNFVCGGLYSLKEGTGGGSGLVLKTFKNSVGLIEAVRVNHDGAIGIGTTPNANAILDVASTTKAFMPPRMTTTQRDAIASPTEGMVVWNITTHAPSWYDGTNWT